MPNVYNIFNMMEKNDLSKSEYAKNLSFILGFLKTKKDSITLKKYPKIMNFFIIKRLV